MTWLVYRSGSGREDNLTPRMPLLKEPAGTTDSFDWDSIHRAVQEILGDAHELGPQSRPRYRVEIRPEFGSGLSSLQLPSFLSS